MSKTRKRVTMQVTVSVPTWMTAREARREVRTLINEQCNYMSLGQDDQQVDPDTVRAVRVCTTTADNRSGTTAQIVKLAERI